LAGRPVAIQDRTRSIDGITEALAVFFLYALEQGRIP
jgi:hypothetical protein